MLIYVFISLSVYSSLCVLCVLVCVCDLKSDYQKKQCHHQSQSFKTVVKTQQGGNGTTLQWVTKSTFISLIFRDFQVFYQIFLSLQVKPCAIITYKHAIYELPHQMPNYLRLRIFGNQKISAKCLNFIEGYLSGQSSCQNEYFVNPSKQFLTNKN